MRYSNSSLLAIHVSLILIEGVGKSSMLMRLTENDFKEDYEVTVGVEFGSFLVQIEDKIIKL